MNLSTSMILCLCTLTLFTIDTLVDGRSTQAQSMGYISGSGSGSRDMNGGLGEGMVQCEAMPGNGALRSGKMSDMGKTCM